MMVLKLLVYFLDGCVCFGVKGIVYGWNYVRFFNIVYRWLD